MPTYFSAVDILKYKRSVCEGYANLTIALLRAIGIPAILVIGNAIYGLWAEADISYDESNHAWVEAYIDNRWVIIDTTWDSANKWENGVISNTGMASHHYFDISIEMFSYNHLINYYSNTVGDVNGDWYINMQDVLLIYQLFRGKLTLNSKDYRYADVNKDGYINMQDVLLVYQFYRGKISTLV